MDLRTAACRASSFAGRPTRAGSRGAARSTGQRRRCSCTTRKADARHQVDVGLLRRRPARRSIPRASSCSTCPNRNFDPVYGDFDNSWTYPNATRVVAVPLRADVQVAARAEERRRGGDEKKDEKDEDKKDARARRTKARASPADTPTPRRRATGGGGKKDDKKDDAKDEPAAAGRGSTSRGSRRAPSCCPRRRATTADLYAVKGKVLYRRAPRAGVGRRQEPDRLLRPRRSARRRRSSTTRTGSSRRPTARNCSWPTSEKYAIVEVKAGAEAREADADRGDGDDRWTRRRSGSRCSPRPIASSATTSTTPACTASTGRRCATSTRSCSTQAVTRWDVNFVLGEFIGELNASHTYRGGGDEEQPRAAASACSASTGSSADGAYRIKHIVRGGPGTRMRGRRSPSPGVGVKEGDYVLAVNGVPLDRRKTRGRRSRDSARPRRPLTVNATPTTTGRAAGRREVPR